MKIKLVKTPLSEFLIIMSYCLYVLEQILSTTQIVSVHIWDIISDVIKVIVILGIIAGVLSKRKFSFNQLIIMGIISVCALLVAFQSSQFTKIVLLAGFLLAGVFLDSDKYLKAYLKVVITSIVITLFLYYLGIYTDESVIQGVRLRLYLGFTYTTYLPNYFFHLVLVYFAVKKTPINVWETILISFINGIIMKWTDTKAVYYGVFVLLFVLWLNNINEKFFLKKMIGRIMIFTVPICAFSAIFFSYTYSSANKIYVLIDKMLSYRLALGYKAIRQYGFKLFGNTIEWVTGRDSMEQGRNYFYVDSSYLNILLSYGIITLLFVVIGMSIIIWKAYKEKKIVLCIVLCVLAVHSITDPQLFDIRYNPFLLLIANVLRTSSKLPIGYEL